MTRRAIAAHDAGSIAIVVPMLNEAATVDDLLDHLAQQAVDEVIVVDGGSTDGSAERVAARDQVRLIRSPRGRGAQLRAGADASSADALLFLHADTRLPPAGVTLVRDALRAGAAGGAFRLRFDRNSPMLSVYAWATRFETGLTTFGDAAIFVRRQAYEQVGGFPPWPILEDVELRRRLKRVGPFVKLRAAATTSARRFRDEGVLRRQMLNAAILSAFHLGVGPHRLARLYATRRSRPH